MEDLFKTDTPDTDEVKYDEVAYKPSYDDDERSFEPKKRKSSGAGCILLFALLVLVTVFAFAVGITLLKNNNITANPGGFAQNTTPTPAYNGDDASPAPTESGYYTPSTPAPTQRPMTQYDGQQPTVTDTVNPFPEIISQVRNGVVTVNNYGKSQSLFGSSDKETLIGLGSGFVISSEGYVLTNAHVIDGATRVTIVLANDTEIPCEVIGADVSTDIAVLRFDNSVHRIKPLCLGNSDTARVGEFVITVGVPSGKELAGTITFGIVSAVDREVNIDGRRNLYIQTDAAMNPGNSGGPLINTKGEVIGVNSAKTITASYDEYGQAITAEGLGFAIPINTAKTIVESLITQGRIVRPGIGVTVRPATEEELAKNNITYGLYVDSTIEGGPGYSAGIKAGDFLLTCNGTELHENEDLVKYVQSSNVGDRLTVTLLRDGQTQTVTVVVGDLNNM